MNITLTALGWDNDRATHLRGSAARHRPGRVARVDRGVCTVLTADGPVRASSGGAVLAAAAGDVTRLPCVGDWVLLVTWPDARVTVEAVLPRRTVLSRSADGRGALGQLLAANLDTVAVVEPAHPASDADRVERLLSLVRESGVRPLVVLTKIDLVADPAVVARRLLAVAPGVPVLPVSAERGVGLDRLRAEVPPGRTLGLLGPADAGKSTLINALAGMPVLSAREPRPAPVSPHVTPTRSALVPLPTGGIVLTTPPTPPPLRRDPRPALPPPRRSCT